MKFSLRIASFSAPIIALAISFGLSSLILLFIGKDPVETFRIMFEYGVKGKSIVSIINRSIPLYISAIAVAVGFKMGLFNIGVEGQYLFAALMAAEAGSHISLPGPLHVAAILAVALISGAAWAGISAFLKVRKNIHEVISTIMLNYIALSFIQWIFNSFFRDDSVEGLNIKTTMNPLNLMLDTKLCRLRLHMNLTQRRSDNLNDKFRTIFTTSLLTHLG